MRTKAVDGLYIGVASSGFTTNNTPVDNRLIFGVWRTTTNYHGTVYIPAEPEYAFRIELFDSNGVAMPKTEPGKRVGTKFTDLDTTFSNSGPRLAIVRPGDEPGYSGQYLFFPHKSGYGGGPFYSPSDLFEIKSPGRYTLRVQFQIIVRTGKGRDKTAHIVRFQPVDYPLVKPATAPKGP